jgi:hypothetical protein
MTLVNRVHTYIKDSAMQRLEERRAESTQPQEAEDGEGVRTE